MPSRYEGFSLSLIEGMSQGLIPVAYPVGVVPEIIKNGENGFIVKNQKEAVYRIKQLLRKKILRFKLSKAAQKTASEFNSDTLAEKLIRFYKRLSWDLK